MSINPLLFSQLHRHRWICNSTREALGGKNIPTQYANDLRRWGLFLAYVRGTENIIPIWRGLPPGKFTLVPADRLTYKFAESCRPIYLLWSHIRNNVVAYELWSRIYREDKVTIDQFVDVAKRALFKVAVYISFDRDRLLKKYLAPLATVSEGELEITGDVIRINFTLNTVIATDLQITTYRYVEVLLEAWERLLKKRGVFEAWLRGSWFTYSLKEIVENMPERWACLPLETHVRLLRGAAREEPSIIIYYEDIHKPFESWDRYLISVQPPSRKVDNVGNPLGFPQ